VRLDFFMLADSAEVVDAPRGARKLNITGGGVTHVGAAEFPYRVPSLAIVIRFFLGADDADTTHALVVRMTGPDGEELLALGHELKFEGDPASHEGEEPSLFIVGQLANAPFPTSGTYHFDLVLDEDLVDRKAITAVEWSETPAEGE